MLGHKPELLREDKGKRYAENIIVGGQRLLNMINDLLYLAKAEANKIQLHIEQIKVDEICDAVMSSFSEMTREKNIKVELEVQRDIPFL